MNRFFVEQLNDSMILSGDNHAHLAYSLRLKAGDEIILFCGDEFDYRYKIINIKKSETKIEFVSKEENCRESTTAIHAFISLIKHDKMSFIYQKLTELGVKEFYPVITEHSQGRKSDFNIERYGRICVEACKQCGGSVVPKVNRPVCFDEIQAVFKDYDAVIFAYEKAETGLKESISVIKRDGLTLKKIAVLIGPEGGFSSEEAEKLKSVGIMPAGLGKRILRAETAAIAAVSAVLYELDW